MLLVETTNAPFVSQVTNCLKPRKDKLSAKINARILVLNAIKTSVPNVPKVIN